MTDLVQTQLDAGVLTIRINRPDKKNALIGEMYLALAEAFEAADKNAEVGAILFTGGAKDFTAGNDLPDFLTWTALTGSMADRFIRAVASAGKPVVAAVRGAAMGVGATILPHCDLVYVSPTAKFLTPFINLGIVPEAGSSQTLAQLAGHRVAAEMLMLGEPFGPEKAVSAGLANAIIADEELDAHAMAQARKLAAKPRAILGMVKALMKTPPEPILARLDREAALFDQCLTRPELKEAVAAFAEKRAPDFSKFK
jgi:enoyl-CoA hydratase/carnithine racemase